MVCFTVCYLIGVSVLVTIWISHLLSTLWLHFIATSHKMSGFETHHHHLKGVLLKIVTCHSLIKTSYESFRSRNAQYFVNKFKHCCCTSISFLRFVCIYWICSTPKFTVTNSSITYGHYCEEYMLHIYNVSSLSLVRM